MVNEITEIFQQKFSDQPLIVRSPGRVNIIGEHTDYNEGFVLPAAIDKAIYVAVSPRTDKTIQLYSTDFNESFETNIADIKPVKGWATYILGVAKGLIEKGHEINGFDLVLSGDVPIGAGLSSSAAVECATVFGLNDIFSLGIEKAEMVRIAQKAEHSYAGVMCGIMDQFASMFGKENSVIKLDCRSLEYEYKPLQLEGYKFVLFNSNVKHTLASSEYNTRRQQCEQGVAWIKVNHPGVNSLRDATLAMLEPLALIDQVIYNRCKYVVEENQRVLDSCNDLERVDLHALGKKMFSTHEGLSKQYEVSCKELDYLVEVVKGNPNVLGARMMGGGFGGCTINLVKEEAIDELIAAVTIGYQKNMQHELIAYTVATGEGTAIVNR